MSTTYYDETSTRGSEVRRPLRETPAKPNKHVKSHEGLPFNSVFFRKHDIRVGAELLCVGRLHCGTRWRVTGITTDPGPGKKKQRLAQVYKLSDEVTLRAFTRDGDALMRRASFQYLSYSAIWQLAVNVEE